MKLVFSIFAAAVSGCGTLCPDANISVPNRTIAHQILAVEEAVGVPAVAYERLKAFLAAAEARIGQKASDSREDASVTLAAIGTLLREQGYTFSSTGVTLLSQALEQRIVDCDTASYLHLAVADRMQVPIRGVMAPGHFFIRWEGEHFSLDWETTMNREATGDEFVACFAIHADAIRNGVYLKTMSREDVLALSAALVAQVFYDRKEYDSAIRYLDAAIASLPTLALAYGSRARCYREKLEMMRARQDVDKALTLDPGNAHAHAFQAVLCMDEEKFAEGIAAATTAIALRPTDPTLYSLRAAAYKLWSAATNSLDDLIRASEDEELAAKLTASRPSFIPIPW